MAAIALAGYGVLLGVAFGLRTVLHRRRTGTTGWVPPPTPAAWVGDGLFTAGVATTTAAPVLDLVGVLRPLAGFDKLAVNIVGAVLLGAGAAVASVAQAQMQSAWRAGIDVSERNELVQEGLFALVRNPFYVGVLAASLGVALMVNIASVAGCLVLLLGCEIDVRLVEEPHLRAAHGDVFATYERSVPRFVPTPQSRHHRPR